MAKTRPQAALPSTHASVIIASSTQIGEARLALCGATGCFTMFGWLRGFMRREVIADVPAGLDLCQDCGRLYCGQTEFQSCERRKQRAADITSAQAAPSPAVAPLPNNTKPRRD